MWRGVWVYVYPTTRYYVEQPAGTVAPFRVLARWRCRVQPRWSERSHGSFPRDDFSNQDISRMLTIAQGLKCPGNEGCRCGDCLDRPLVSRVQAGPKAPDLTRLPCNASLVCDCPTCESERASLVARGARTEIRQPWEAVRRAA